ncbi:His/Glu/Gln/Arg/opine family amino ABC transporter, permease, 3-TM region [Segniliparus rugosus ATCC BAA-974]|uniref:His/Glu/Gln/Arg/opine family amino ABC transporter, permease, 3-TM region n=1 Tax=Segniliparus rugosus (strain ATCC BAA-974 / DSM 45345 / CCUG 50838 / CIP 108380 / JCM 13579 / CDC 945) TaxID=679197 RepID=E5XNA8_SEGRC|nr:ABC transporter substrate-binding protein/permease [Segniliparus rugosus]EFV14168.2 His/Glu/Gln/Arg/opine family amino ABC transporter, permease, 3-TM region [Segniliparus rugosus ATCC BAA-974]
MLCLLWGAVGSPASAEQALRFGTEGTYSPFTYHDPATGELVGLDVEVARALAAKMGRRAEFVEAPFDSLFAGLDAGQFDFVANQIAATPEREQAYSLTAPYIYATGLIITRAGDDSIRSPGDLKGKLVADSPVSNWGVLAAKLGARLEASDATQALILLEQGRVDAVVQDDLTFLAYKAKVPQAKVDIAVRLAERAPSVFPARKGDPLAGQASAALEALRADGTLDRISAKYLRPEQAPAAARLPSQWETVAANLWPMAKALARVTLPLAAICFVLGLVIAVLTALARISRNRAVSALARSYVSVIRGTPLLVQLFLIYFALPEFGVKLPPFPSAVVALSLSVGAYASEVVRAAILAVPSGQSEAARALGFSRGQTLRLVVFPQAAKIAVPPLSNTLIALVKDTSLAATIQVTELFRTAQIAAAPIFRYFALYATAAVFYWVVCLVLSWFQGRLERRLERGAANTSTMVG